MRDTRVHIFYDLVFVCYFCIVFGFVEISKNERAVVLIFILYVPYSMLSACEEYNYMSWSNEFS